MKVSKKAERLARAIAVVENSLGGEMAFDRGHIYWPESLEKAESIIKTQNFLVWFENYGRSLHGDTEDAKFDLELYQQYFKGGVEGHKEAFAVVLGEEYEPSPDVSERTENER